MSAIFAGRTATEWEELLIKADIGCVQADEGLEGEFCADHPHAKANALSVEVEHRISESICLFDTRCGRR